ncbi:MAG: hypothetical protein JOZ69_24365 [Myxococcales bacterium]|nr:hypothetical protein [Myxococcales bacterium]
MKLPAVAGLRLVTRAAGRPPRPPLGVAQWSADAPALAVLLESSGADLDDPAQVAAQLPEPNELPPGTPVFVLGVARSGPQLLRRLGLGTTAVGRAPRCTALVGRGYVGVAAGADEAGGADLAWGFSSPC